MQYNQYLQRALSTPDIGTSWRLFSVRLAVTSKGHMQNISKGNGFSSFWSIIDDFEDSFMFKIDVLSWL